MRGHVNVKCLNRWNREWDNIKPSKLTARLCVTNYRTRNGDYKKKLYVGRDGKDARLKNSERK
jgi:hypothetical protein